MTPRPAPALTRSPPGTPSRAACVRAGWRGSCARMTLTRCRRRGGGRRRGVRGRFRAYVIAYRCMSTTRRWDGRSYDRISAPMEALGRGVLERLDLRGDETVLDAGCGSGRITQALLERLPRGRVIAVDASSSMLAAASERLAQARHANDERLELRLGDLLELELA